MASDVLFDDRDSDKLNLSCDNDIFMNGRLQLMDTKELYLTDLVCSKDASSSDSGISTFEDFHDIANVTDLNSLMDSELKDFAFDFKVEEDDISHKELIKQEPLSPSPTLSSESGCDDFTLHQPVPSDQYSCYNDVSIKDESSCLVLPTHQQQQQQQQQPQLPLQHQQAVYSPQESYIIEPMCSPLGFQSSPEHSCTSPTSSFPMFPSSMSPALTPYNQHSQSITNPQISTYYQHSGSSSPTSSSPPTQHNYMVVPNIKRESPSSSIVSPLGGSLIHQVGLTKPVSAININAILNSKVKIQPKPGSEAISMQANSQWLTTASPLVPFSNQPITAGSVINSQTIVSTNGITSITDEKSFKRAQRIIKNRESASLSRKRKKEYLSSLEEKLQQCQDENNRLQRENDTLKRLVNNLQRENSHLQVPTGLSAAKKVCLMCLALMFTLHLSPYSLVGFPSGTQSHPSLSRHGTGRQLLSVPDDDIAMQTAGGSNSDSAMWSRMKEQRFLMGSDKHLGLLAEKMNITEKLGNMCPMFFNSTESLRLAEQLRGWMISQEEGKKRNKEAKRQKKKQKDYPTLRRFGANLSSSGGYHQTVPNSNRNGPPVSGSPYPLQVFQGGYGSREQLLDAFPRRNDTFYVLSFSLDYFLVPATAHNKTMRPRMSLLMPVFTPGINKSTGQSEDSIVMMQIDCEIINTNLIQINRSAFPQDDPFNSTFHDGNNSNSSNDREAADAHSDSHAEGTNFQQKPYTTNSTTENSDLNEQKKQQQYWEKLRENVAKQN